MNSRNFVSSVVISSIVFLNSIVSVNAFFDVKQGDWYADYTQSLVVAGVIDGSKLTFDPLAHVTREVAAKIVVKAAGYVDKDLIAPLVPSFHDVPINRAEMSKIVVKAMNLLVVESKKVIEPIEKPVVKPVKSPSSSGGSGGGTSGIPAAADNTQVDTGTGTGTGTTSNTFTDDFSSFTPQYYPDSATFVPWLVQFGGYGTVGIEAENSNNVLHLSPKVSDAPNLTSSSLVTGPKYNGAIQLLLQPM